MGGCVMMQAQKKPENKSTSPTIPQIPQKINNSQSHFKLDQTYNQSSSIIQQQIYIEITSSQQQNNDKQIQDVNLEYIATSKIYRRNKNNLEQNTRDKDREEQEEQFDIHKKSYRRTEEIYKEQDLEIDGVIQEQDGYSRIQIYNSKVALQFTIPKTKAGPIIVPFIDYEVYLYGNLQNNQ